MIDQILQDKYEELGNAHVEAMEKIHQLQEQLKDLYLKFGKIQKDINRDEHIDEFWLKDLFPHRQEIEKLRQDLNEAVEIIKGSSEIKLKFCQDNQWALVHDLMNKERQFLAKVKKD